MKFLKRFMSWFGRRPEAPKAVAAAAEPPIPSEPRQKAPAEKGIPPFVDPRFKRLVEEVELGRDARTAKAPTRKEAISMLARDAVTLRHQTKPRPRTVKIYGRFAVNGRITRISALFTFVDHIDGRFAAALDKTEEARLADLDFVLRRHFN